MSVKKTADTLENFTWGLAVTLLVLSLLSAMTLSSEGEIQDTKMRGKIDSSEPIQQQPFTAPTQKPLLPSP